MRAIPRSGWLARMKTSHLAIAAVSLAVTAPVAAAAEGVPPTEGGVSCHQTVKKSYRLGQVKRRGTAVKVTCDGPLKVLVMPDFDAGSDAQTELAETYGGHYPALAKAKRVALKEAGTITVRPRWTKAALKILAHHRSTKIIIGLGTMRTDGRYWSGPGDWGHSKILR
jgi:hypothetical protein